MATGKPQAPSQGPLPIWELAEAKANLSKVVRLAVAGRRQRATVTGRDAVAVSTAELERLNPSADAPSLHDLLSRSPLNRLQFGRESIEGPVRKLGI